MDENFERLFNQDFPGIKSMDWQDWLKLDTVDHFVQNALKQSFNLSGIGSDVKTHFSSEVFETHKQVIAKIKIPQHVQIDEISLYVNENQIKIVYKNKNHFIKLPVHVKSKVAKALYKNGIIQIQMKKSMDSKYHEVYIRSL